MSTPSKRRASDMMKLMMGGYAVTLADEANNADFYVVFHGPKDSPYEGGEWNVHVQLPMEYPYKSPSLGFCNRMYHPNVDEISGSVCLDVINQTWSPMFDLVNIFEVFLPQLLCYPNPSDPLNGEAAALMLRSPSEYMARIKDHVSKYAMVKKKKKERKERKADAMMSSDEGGSRRSSGSSSGSEGESKKARRSHSRSHSGERSSGGGMTSSSSIAITAPTNTNGNGNGKERARANQYGHSSFIAAAADMVSASMAASSSKTASAAPSFMNNDSWDNDEIGKGDGGMDDDDAIMMGEMSGMSDLSDLSDLSDDDEEEEE